jgi:hypothetical protein
VNAHEDRSAADELLPIMVDLDKFKQGWVKLSPWARQHLIGRATCPERHRLAECVRTVGSVWVLWRGSLHDRGWRADWLDEITDPGAMRAWCSPCGFMHWSVDLTDPATPRVVR